MQRRHQKVLEESPSPALDPALRAAMSEAAVAFARAISYRSAGTAEFVLDGGEFFFLELNGRIQVEHPVTELVTGLDLVAAQLELAEGGSLPALPEPHGHAVEVRLYAEDPRTFLPQAGRLERLRLPTGVRVDAGVEEGDEVGIAYDPMIAKLIASGETRDEALDRLAGRARRDRGRGRGHEPALPALARLRTRRCGRATRPRPSSSSILRCPRPRRPAPPPWRGVVPAQPAAASAPRAARRDRSTRTGTAAGAEHSTISAPMPGTVLRVLVRKGDRVEPRQPLVVLEAMKMETPLVSPYAGVVQEVHVAEGDRVAGGATVVELEE